MRHQRPLDHPATLIPILIQTDNSPVLELENRPLFVPGDQKGRQFSHERQMAHEHLEIGFKQIFGFHHVHIEPKRFSIKAHGHAQNLGQIQNGNFVFGFILALDAFLIPVIHDGAKRVYQAESLFFE